MYDPALIQPMRDEMTAAGFEEVRTADDVDSALADTSKSTLIFVNSVCGCSAGVARPAVIESLKNELRPANLVTAFAGNDVEAVNRVRELFLPYPPSSPCAGIFRDGKLVHMVERHQIEGQTAGTLAKILGSAYDRFCGEAIDESAEIHDPLADLEVSVAEVRGKISGNPDLALLDVREARELSWQTMPWVRRSLSPGRVSERSSSIANMAAAACKPCSFCANMALRTLGA